MILKSLNTAQARNKKINSPLRLKGLQVSNFLYGHTETYKHPARIITSIGSEAIWNERQKIKANFEKIKERRELKDVRVKKDRQTKRFTQTMKE